MIGSFLQDLRYGLRTLVKKPGFSLVAIGTLALGIGATTAIFSFAYALTLRPLPYDDPARIVLVRREANGQTLSPISIPTARDLEQRNRVFESLATFQTTDQSLSGSSGDPERLQSLLISAQFLRVLGLRPSLGRGFEASDDRLGAERTALLSHELWQRRFGGDPSITDKTISLNGLQYSVLGVLPPGLSSERLGSDALGDVWLPIGLFLDQMPAEERATRVGLAALGRLATGVSQQDAIADVERIDRELHEEYPADYGTGRFVTVSLDDHVFGQIRPKVLALLGAVVFVLLIACANLANLLLARATDRQQELATRAALGAGRRRLVGQMLTESLLLAGLGGGLGMAIAYLGIQWGNELIPAALPAAPLPAGGAQLNALALVVTAGLSGLSPLVFGLVPAFQAARANPSTLMLRTAVARPPKRLRQLLVALQLGMALVLMIGTALMLKSLLNLSRQGPGFDPRNILTLQVTLAQTRYADAAAAGRFLDQTLERLRSLPGVNAATVTSTLPMFSGTTTSPVVAGDRPLPPSSADMGGALFQTVSPGFFQTIGIPLFQGRDFSADDDDREGADRVVIVNRALARSLWPDPNEDVVGKKLAFEFDGNPANPIPRWRRIIGIVGDVRHQNLRIEHEQAVYTPYTQPPAWWVGEEWPSLALLARTETDPLSRIQAARAEISQVDSQLPVWGAQSLEQLLSGQLAESRMVLSLIMSFAGLALLLALVGVYGVIAFTVSARMQEIGVRIALGAKRKQIFLSLARQSLALVLLGLGTGLGMAYALSRFLASLLFDASPVDPTIFAGTAALLALVALVATVVPAWKATRIDPAVTLRYE